MILNKLLDFAKNTAKAESVSLIDGNSIKSIEELNLLGVLKLEQCEVMENFYIRLRYKVIE